MKIQHCGVVAVVTLIKGDVEMGLAAGTYAFNAAAILLGLPTLLSSIW